MARKARGPLLSPSQRPKIEVEVTAHAKCRVIMINHEALMIKLATAVAALTLLTMGTAIADMAAGTLECSSTVNELTWDGASPSDLLLLGSKCGFTSSAQACPTTPNDFLELAERKKCRGARSGPLVAFVCTGSENQVKKAIEDLCRALFP
jgi:hypothetical protein